MKKKEEQDKEKEASDKEKKKEVSLEKELEDKKKEHDVVLDKYLRICAEFDNARKRWEKEKEEVVKFANFVLLRDLLVILDEMEQAVKMIKEHQNIIEIAKGLEIMFNNFTNTLKKRGIEPIEAKGKKFDPHIHEIAAARGVEEDIDEPIVLEEVQKGYTLEGKVLRTAKVIVGIHKKAEAKEEKATAEAEEEIEEKKEKEIEKGQKKKEEGEEVKED